MKLFWVLGWDNYYPRSDNFLASFDNKDDALKYISDYNKYYDPYDRYEIINISDRL